MMIGLGMQLSPHFTLAEAITSQTAARLGIDNSPTSAMLPELQKTAAFMEQIRVLLGNKPITVTSWYRCSALEAAIVGRENSSGHHPLGGAVDFICPRFGTPYEVAHHLAIAKGSLPIGQLIYEYGSWVHISRLSVPNPINKIITIDKFGVAVGIINRY